MKPFVVLLSPLIADILTAHFFTTRTPTRTDTGALGPQFAAPQRLVDRRHSLKNLPSRETFDDADHRGWAIPRHRLPQDMDRMLVGPDFHKDDRVALRDCQPALCESGINLLAENDTPLLGGAYHMGHQHGDIGARMHVCAQKSYVNTPEQSEASFGESDPQRLKSPQKGDLS